ARGPILRGARLPWHPRLRLPPARGSTSAPTALGIPFPATAHRLPHTASLMAALCVSGAAAADWREDDHWAKHPLVAAATAGGCGTLPDVIEPALHPCSK